MSAARLDLVPGTCALDWPTPRPSEMTCDPPQSAGIRRALSPGPPLAGALLLETSIPRPLHSCLWTLSLVCSTPNLRDYRRAARLCKEANASLRNQKPRHHPKPGVSAGRFRLLRLSSLSFVPFVGGPGRLSCPVGLLFYFIFFFFYIFFFCD